MFWFKLKHFFQRHWVVLAVIAVCLIAVVFPIWYLAGIEENTRRYIISRLVTLHDVLEQETEGLNG